MNISSIISRLESSGSYHTDSAIPPIAEEAAQALRNLNHFVEQIAEFSIWNFDDRDGNPMDECQEPSDGFLDSHLCLMDEIQNARALINKEDHSD